MIAHCLPDSKISFDDSFYDRYADVMVHRLLDLGLKDEDAARSEENDEEKMTLYADIANNCNVKKFDSKAAQDTSDKIYFATYLDGNPMYMDAAVIGTGPKSFSVVIKSLGLVQRLFIDKMDGGVVESFNEETRTLTLQRRPLPADVANQFTYIDLSIATPVVILCEKSKESFIYVKFSLVCTGTCEERGINNVRVSVGNEVALMIKSEEVDIAGIALEGLNIGDIQ